MLTFSELAYHDFTFHFAARFWYILPFFSSSYLQKIMEMKKIQFFLAEKRLTPWAENVNFSTI